MRNKNERSESPILYSRGELAAIMAGTTNIRGQEPRNQSSNKYDWKICQRCTCPVPVGNKFCSNTCETLFKQGK